MSKVWLFSDRVIVLVLVLFLILFFQATSTFAQNDGRILHDGVFRVKFTEAVVRHLEKTSLRKGADQEVVTGNRAIDRANKRFRVTNMKRVFRHGGKYEAKHRKYGLHRWYTVELEKGVSLAEALPGFKSLDDVQQVEPIYKKTFIGADSKLFGSVAVSSKASLSILDQPTNDPLFSKQWHYENTGQTSGSEDADINLINAWKVQAGNPNVIVSVHDGGIDVDHEDLAANMWRNSGEIAGNGIDDDDNGYIDDIHGYNFGDNQSAISAHEHGTHVGGTVAATTNNGKGVAGVAGGSGSGDGVRLMSCETFGTFSSAGFEDSYIYAADNGAVISQNSWTYLSPGDYEQSVLDAIDYFIAEAGRDEDGNQIGPMDGGIVIFAAANFDSSEDFYPSVYEPVLAVAGTNHKDKKSWYSNYGSWVDIAAPGGETELVLEEGVFSTLPDNEYGFFQGTSMACPHVSGVAALVVSHYGGPGFNADELRSRLVTAGENINALNPGYVDQLGSGRIDAALALDHQSTALPPARITDLKVISTDRESVVVSWTVPEDEDDGGPAKYDIRYSTDAINASNFYTSANVSNPPAPLAPGATQSFEIKELTAGTQFFFAIRSIDKNANVSMISNVVRQITEGGSKIEISPASLTADLKTGEKKNLEFTIRNTGEDAMIYSFTTDPENTPWLRIVNDGGGQIAPGSSTVVTVSFSAQSLLQQTYTAKLIVQSNDPSNRLLPISCTLNVTNNGAPIAKVSPASLNFEEVIVGGELSLPVKVSNQGSENLVISEITSNNDLFSYEGTLPVTVGPIGNKNIELVFKPTSPDNASGEVIFKTNDPKNAQLKIAVSGEGTLGPEMYFFPDVLQETASNNEITIAYLDVGNRDGADFKCWLEGVSDGPVSFIKGNPYPETISEGVQVHFEVTIDARGLAVGTHTGSVIIHTDIPGREKTIVPVKLTIRPSMLAATPDSIRAELTYGEKSSRKVTVTNNDSDEASYQIRLKETGIQSLGAVKRAASISSSDVKIIAEASEQIANYATTRAKFSTEVIKRIDSRLPRTLAGTPVYATYFEEFDLGDATQRGWSASDKSFIDDVHPFSGKKHMMVTSAVGESQYVSSPVASMGDESHSTLSSKVNFDFKLNTSVQVYIGTSGGFSNVLLFRDDGVSMALLNKGDDELEWEEIDTPFPKQYFDLKVEVERATKKFRVFYDNKEVFSGAGSAIDVSSVYFSMSSNVQGTVLYVDDVAISDGRKENLSYINVSPMTGTIPAGKSVELTVEFDASRLAFEEYSTDIIVSTGGGSDLIIPATLSLGGAAAIDVSPSQLDIGAYYRGSSYQMLTIANKGTAPLSFDGEIVQTDSTEVDVLGWLSLGTSTGTLYPGQETIIDVFFDAVELEPGTYHAAIELNNNSEENSKITIPVVFTVLSPPQLVVAPDSLSETLNSGMTLQKTIRLKNNGESSLEYSFLNSQGVKANAKKNNTEKIYPKNTVIAKGAHDTRRGHPVLAGVGGPDHFGYTWMDSDQSGGPVFNWESIWESGEQLSLGDEGSATVRLPFDFEFYGQKYQHVTVESNGLLSFGDDDGLSFYTNLEIPDAAAPNNFIAPFWDDLVADYNVRVKAYDDKFVVQYTDVPYYDNSSLTNTFQVLLYKDGTIVFQYLEVQDLESATIGIENQDGRDGIQISFNHSFLHNNHAIILSPGKKGETWVKVNPLSGVIYEGEEQEITLTFNSEGLKEGTYATTLKLFSTDPENPLYPIHVVLNVLDNNPPVISEVQPVSIAETESGSLQLKATDADGDDVKVRLIGPPPFVTLTTESDGTAGYVIKPTFGTRGNYVLKAEATDERGAVSIMDISLTVIKYGVQTLSLIDSRTGKVIRTFRSMVTIDRSDPAFPYLVIKANTMPAQVGSVTFKIDGKQKNGTRQPPYIFDDVQKWRAGSYVFRAQAFTDKNGKGKGGRAVQCNVTVTDGLANAMAETLSIHPNPVERDLTLTVDSAKEGMWQVVVTDATGLTVLRSDVTHTELLQYKIDLSNFVPGIYYLQLLNESGQRITSKIIKR